MPPPLPATPWARMTRGMRRAVRAPRFRTSRLRPRDRECRREVRRRCRWSAARSAIPASTSPSCPRKPAASPTIRASPRRRPASRAITYIDGDAGVLMYRGYPIEQLAKQSSFLEVAYLLMHGELPTPAQFSAFEQRSHASHDDARGVPNVPVRLPPRRASDGDAGRHARLDGELLPRHARPRGSGAAPPRRDPPDREGADDRRRLLSLFDRLADALSAATTSNTSTASCT